MVYYCGIIYYLTPFYQLLPPCKVDIIIFNCENAMQFIVISWIKNGAPFNPIGYKYISLLFKLAYECRFT